MKRIRDEEIIEQTRAPIVLSGHRRVAQAQLESCEEEHNKIMREFIEDIEKLWPIPVALKEKYLK